MLKNPRELRRPIRRAVRMLKEICESSLKKPFLPIASPADGAILPQGGQTLGSDLGGKKGLMRCGGGDLKTRTKAESQN
jgi:hypothetical protein